MPGASMRPIQIFSEKGLPGACVWRCCKWLQDEDSLTGRGDARWEERIAGKDASLCNRVWSW